VTDDQYSGFQRFRVGVWSVDQNNDSRVHEYKTEGYLAWTVLVLHQLILPSTPTHTQYRALFQAQHTQYSK